MIDKKLYLTGNLQLGVDKETNKEYYIAEIEPILFSKEEWESIERTKPLLVSIRLPKEKKPVT